MFLEEFSGLSETEDKMSKGNINYKYLRRRKNWFQRNWKALIMYIVLILAVLGAGAFVCIRFTPLGSKLGITQSNESKENKASPGADNNAQGDGSNKNNGEQQTKEVTWIDLKSRNSRRKFLIPYRPEWHIRITLKSTERQTV